MSQSHKDEDVVKQSSRPRANTTITSNSFPSLTSWRKQRQEVLTVNAPVPPPLSLPELLEALTPPTVPSVHHARSLASMMSSLSLLPKPALLHQILLSLCSPQSLPALQAAGLDILSAYLDNSAVSTQVATSDKLGYLTLLSDPTLTWSTDLWEPRFRALQAIKGRDRIPEKFESQIVDALKLWIRGAFEGLLLSAEHIVERPEALERRRSINILATFLATLSSPADVNIGDQQAKMLAFFTDLVSLSLKKISPDLSLTPHPAEIPAATPSHSRSPCNYHSPSLSVESLFNSQTENPCDIAITLYLDYLTSQTKSLLWYHLKSILSVLFRCLAVYASRLPRLIVTETSKPNSPIEERIITTIAKLFSGPYSATCFVYLRQHFKPPSNQPESIDICLQTAIGAARTLRNHIRSTLYGRIARAYIQEEASIGYSVSGAPGHLAIGREMMERAWPKDTTSAGWDLQRLGRFLQQNTEAWVHYSLDTGTSFRRAMKEQILDEISGIIQDVLQELDSRDDPLPALDADEGAFVGAILYHLCTYVLTLKSADGTPIQLPLVEPQSAPTPLLRTISHLLCRDHKISTTPHLSIMLLLVADHLSDMDTAKLPDVMCKQRILSPTSPSWLNSWQTLLSNPVISGSRRPLTRKALMSALKDTYDSIKDMPLYRCSLSDLVLEFCQRQLEETNSGSEYYDVVWSVLGQELVFRATESHESEGEGDSVTRYINILLQMLERYDDISTIEDFTNQAPSSTMAGSEEPAFSAAIGISRGSTDAPGPGNQSALPAVMSLLSSLSGNASGSQNLSSPTSEVKASSPSPPNTFPPPPSCRISIGPITALITAFCHLSFTPLARCDRNIELVHQIHAIFVRFLSRSKSPKVKLAILKFLMHLRVDCDHHIYYQHVGFDIDGLVKTLASQINHTRHESSHDPSEGRRPRDKAQRSERRPSRARRGGTTRPSASEHSRSRSRATRTVVPSRRLITKEPLWFIPDLISFAPPDSETPSSGLITYHQTDAVRKQCLSISDYLDALAILLQTENNWEVISYVLCHLPSQLANKHFFCGPLCRVSILKLMTVLSSSIVQEQSPDNETGGWPPGIPSRDATGLAYHTLSVLISYKHCFDTHQRHILVDIFHRGLDDQPSTMKCCLHALTLAAFELEPSMTKYLSLILQKLSQIMSNPETAVHILGFIGVVGSCPTLHANFTDDDYKMVFGVALQYLQHHNRMGGSPSIPWALFQYVRIISYYIVYIWFLAIKLPDRPRHINYIIRQVLIANEGKDQVDEASEVCFDWLARYTYATLDPRPANSVLGDIIMQPTTEDSIREIAVGEKTWILGNSVVTIRTLPKLGWVEVMSRRPSGYTKFLCRVENLPLAGPGEVNPDLISEVASLVMDRSPGRLQHPESNLHLFGDTSEYLSLRTPQDTNEEVIPDPDPITGYVWSKTAPSQRRKEVALDPSFFALQLSAYPDRLSPRQAQMLVSPEKVPSFIRSLDRIPVIDTHKVGVMYVAPRQRDETAILRNTHGSPAYTRFLEGLGRLINLRGQVDVYAGGLDPDEDGEYTYAWWDDTGQVLYHTATMMPTSPDDPQCNNKKRHLGNDFVRIVWNDSGAPYQFNTLSTQFQFINIVVEPHSSGFITAFSESSDENEYFKLTVQRAPGMSDFTPIGEFKVISASRLPSLVRQLALLSDWYASIFQQTHQDTEKVETTTNWQHRLQAIKRFRQQQTMSEGTRSGVSIGDTMDQETGRDFSACF
jgi:tuberous sclerosis protein 2